VEEEVKMCDSAVLLEDLEERVPARIQFES
jgi:hypothetical protein